MPRLEIAKPDEEPKPRKVGAVRIYSGGQIIGAHEWTENDGEPSIDTESVNGVKGAPVLCVWANDEHFEYYGNIAWSLQYYREH